MMTTVPATRTEAWRNSRSGSPRPDREVEQQIGDILGERRERSDLRFNFNGMQQRRVEEGDESEAEIRREQAVKSEEEKKIPRSEEGTDEKATPGIVGGCC